jgi:hypothetical protein
MSAHAQFAHYVGSNQRLDRRRTIDGDEAVNLRHLPHISYREIHNSRSKNYRASQKHQTTPEAITGAYELPRPADSQSEYDCVGRPWARQANIGKAAQRLPVGT